MNTQPNNRFSPFTTKSVPGKKATPVKKQEFRTVELSKAFGKLFDVCRKAYTRFEGELPAVLAAPQIGIDKRIIVVLKDAQGSGRKLDPAERLGYQVLVNPEIIFSANDRIAVKALNNGGGDLTIDLEGVAAQLFQEAMACLDGPPAPELAQPAVLVDAAQAVAV